MKVLSNKVVLILSPQFWGPMHVSKHHYAIELAKLGNTVYFLNPPTYGRIKKTNISKIKEYENLFIIDHVIRVPYQLRFHFIKLFHFYMKWHIKSLLQCIHERVDIVWSFDLGNFYPFKYFPKDVLKIFHPVDEPLNKRAFNSAAGADVMFSVTEEILEKYKYLHLPGYRINHGVNDLFLNVDASDNLHSPITVGFSGNLLRKDIDRSILLEIFQQNPDLRFIIWGSIDAKTGNMGGVNDEESEQFISTIKNMSNVKLQGLLPSSQLPGEYQHVDAFLICYDINKDQSNGTNYHKIMEFLSSGKLIVSNNVTAYKDQPDLVMMIKNRACNLDLPAFFKECIGKISILNSPEKIRKRIEFAKDNSYRRQVERIDHILERDILN